jgi:hypothetical protein
MTPCSRIHATATLVSRPPEKAMPTRSPTGRELRTLDTATTLLGALARGGGRPLGGLGQQSAGRLLAGGGLAAAVWRAVWWAVWWAVWRVDCGARAVDAATFPWGRLSCTIAHRTCSSWGASRRPMPCSTFRRRTPLLPDVEQGAVASGCGAEGCCFRLWGRGLLLPVVGQRATASRYGARRRRAWGVLPGVEPGGPRGRGGSRRLRPQGAVSSSRHPQAPDRPWHHRLPRRGLEL